MASFLRKLSKRSSTKSSSATGSANSSRSNTQFSHADPKSTYLSAQPNTGNVHGHYIQEAPPEYAPTAPAGQLTVPQSASQTSVDSPYAFLKQFDTIFLIDDSGSMRGRSWRETAEALSAITPICTEQDADGIDIYFLNHRNPLTNSELGGYTNVTTTAAVREIFNTVVPSGGTPTGTRLNKLLKPYLKTVSAAIKQEARGNAVTVKPINIIVITDGVATDDVESVIVKAAKELDSVNAEPWQVGIQFFQVGQEKDAAADLADLDDALSREHGIRDMVDTVPWKGDDGASLTAANIMKITMGAVNRKLDRKRLSHEMLRRR